MRMLMRLAAVACVLGFAAAATPADDKDPLTDNDFVANCWTCGIFEVEAGKLAANNAADAEVKKFAEKMVAHHSRTNEDLKAAAKVANIPLPAKLTEEQQRDLEKLRTLKGADFDRAYIAHVVKKHEDGEKMLNKASKELKDPVLKGFAVKLLPTIQEHLKQARQINDRLSKQ
jgi:putative membrane protein